MKAIRTVLAAIRRADCQFNLIEPGDKIVIGVSGGKDSLVLSYALNLYAKFSKKDFTIQPVILDLGFPNFDAETLKTYFTSIGLSLRVEPSQDVYKILLANQGEADHLPCSICSRMKKAAINKVAKDMGFNKVAFAHHADDAIETLFMNEIYGGSMATFSPKMTLERANIVFIRPLILLRESDIINAARELKLPVKPSPCPADKHTTRQETKEWLHTLYHAHPFAKENLLTMLTNYDRAATWFDEDQYPVEGTHLHIRPVRSKAETLRMMTLRYLVFIVEQKVPFEEEYDGSDERAKNFLLYEDDIPVGTLRYIQEGRAFRIGRFCVLKAYRGKGYGKVLFAFIEDYLRQRYTPCEIYFHAQTQVQGFYEKFGYVPEGNIFDEAGISHITMRKRI
jgi:tRNA 2-thiocytidine biosynthesis protein TtcA